MRLLLVAAGSATLACAGCTGASRAVVDQPSAIDLKTALVSTVEAISAARDKATQIRGANQGVPIGLNVCTVSATFNIAASGIDERGISGTIGTPPNLYVSAAVAATSSATSTASRGNQITVVFTSPACNPADTLGTKSPGDVVLLEREIEAAREGAPDPIYRGPPAGATARARQAVRGSGGPPSSNPSAPGPTTPSTPAQPTPTPGDSSSLNCPAPGRGPTFALQVRPECRALR